MAVRRMHGNDMRGIKQDECTRIALVNRQKRRRFIEKMEELEKLVSEISYVNKPS